MGFTFISHSLSPCLPHTEHKLRNSHLYLILYLPACLTPNINYGIHIYTLSFSLPPFLPCSLSFSLSFSTSETSAEKKWTNSANMQKYIFCMHKSSTSSLSYHSNDSKSIHVMPYLHFSGLCPASVPDHPWRSCVHPATPEPGFTMSTHTNTF